ncbi:MAG: hypothetical protein AAF532_15730 [Planctomycetota bacterium]
MPSQSSPSPLFPLPTVPFERYMLADDRPGHPMTNFLEVDLEGPVDVDRLDDLLDDLLPRHPLLTARVEEHAGGARNWSQHGDRPRIRVTSSGDPLFATPAEARMDLSEEPGTRLWWRPTGGERGTLVVQMHHAVSDGLGKRTFLFEWLNRYAAAGGADVPPLAAPKPEILNFRRDPPRSDFVPAPFWKPARRKVLLERLRREVHVAFGADPDPLPRTCTPPAQPSVEPSYRAARISPEQFVDLRRRAKASGVTVNDWLLAAQFVAMRDWAVRCGETDPQTMRILVPISLRSPDEMPGPAMNRVTYKFVWRTTEQVDDLPALLAGITEEMQEFREERPANYLRWLNRLEVIPGGLAKRIDPDRCVATMCLSNVGDLAKAFSWALPAVDGRLVAGDVTVTDVRSAPPKRPHMRASNVVYGYGGGLHMVACCEGRELCRGESEDFLNLTMDTAAGMLPDGV